MAAITYENFDLLVDRSRTGYRAKVTRSLAGEATTEFALSLSPDELADFLSRMSGGTRQPASASNDASPGVDPRDFGARLYEAAFAGPVGLCLRRSLDEAERRKVGLRIRLRLDRAAIDLAELPWEFLFVPDLNRFLALSDRTPIVRYVELDRPVQPLAGRLPLTVLAIVSDPQGLARLATQQEWENLQGALSSLIERNLIRLERLEAATLPALQMRLRQGPVDLVHFVGHGFFDPESNTGGLIFEREQGGYEIVTAETLGALLHDHDTLRLAFLNACQGAQGGRSDPFAGVAQRLVQQGAPAVLAMQFPVSDAAAITLSQVFYQALADGLPADTALSEARKAIAARGSDGEWATPVLFSRSDDNYLFDLLDVLPPPACPYPGMVPFRAEDARFFYGREDEIDQMLRHLRHQHLLFVVGPSGSGKSSLIAAGVLPRLANSAYFPPGYWLVRTLRPGDQPLQALAAAIQGDVSQPAEAVARLLAANAPAQRLLLVVDQFEELFSLARPDERRRLIAVFQALRKAERCALLVAMRADFYPDLMNSDLWPVDASQRLEIASLRGDAMRRAISAPAREAQVDIEDALVERLMADVAGEPGVLPMLQETLVNLWGRMSRRRISLENYEQLGDGQRSGLAVAIAAKADATLADLTPAEQGVARRIFMRLIQFGQGRFDTRRQLPETELKSAGDDAATFGRVLKHLSDNRLLTLSGGEGGAERLVDISHERLITEWPRFREWAAQHKEAELSRRRLEAKTQEWVRLGRSEGGLLDKAELREADAWIGDPIAKDLGISDDLRTLAASSRKAINPGWHRWGTVGLALGATSIAATLAGLYILLRVNMVLGSVQVVTWLFVAILGIMGFIAFLASRRADSHVVPRFSHRVAAQRSAQIAIGGALLAAGTLWGLLASQQLAIEKQCTELGFVGDAEEPNVALSYAGMSERDAEFFRQRLIEVSDLEQPNIRFASLKEATVCRRFLAYQIELRVETDPAGEETTYFAAVTDRDSGHTMTERESGVGRCNRIEFLASKVAIGQGFSSALISPASAVNAEAEPISCEAYRKNEDGYRYLAEGWYDDAEKLLTAAIELDPEYAVAHANLGIVYYLTERYEEGVRELETAVALSGELPNVSFLVNLAIACYRAGDYPCAVQRNQQAIAADPQRRVAYNNLAVVYREMGEYGKAHALLHQSEVLLAFVEDETQLQAESRILAKHRGILAFRERNWTEATRLLEEADEPGGPYEEEVVYYLAASAAQQGKRTEACRYFKRYDQVPSGGLFKETKRREDAAKQMIALECS